MPLDPGAPSATELGEIDLARIGPADRVSNGDGVAGRHYEAAARIAYGPNRFALGISRDDDRAPGGQDRVEATRDDVAGEAARKP